MVRCCFVNWKLLSINNLKHKFMQEVKFISMVFFVLCFDTRILNFRIGFCFLFCFLLLGFFWMTGDYSIWISVNCAFITFLSWTSAHVFVSSSPGLSQNFHYFLCWLSHLIMKHVSCLYPWLTWSISLI